MSKRNKISLGTPTEELPEWTLSLDFTESQQDTIKEEKKHPESVVSTESTFSEPSSQPVQPAGSGLSSGLGGGLNTEFVIGNDTTTSESNYFSQPLPPQNNFATENVLDFGGDTALPSQDAESITTLDVSDDREKADTITTIEQPAPVEEPVVEAVQNPVTENVPKPQPTPVVEPVPAPATEVQPEPVVETITEPVSEPQPAPVVEPVPEPVVEPVAENVSEPVSEPVDVDSQLSEMANSVVTEDNEEQLLSAAADLIKNEQTAPEIEDIKIVDEMDHSTPENNADVLDLLKQLDVSENIERMQTTTQEDIADVIEQTDTANELETAVPVEESISASDLEPTMEEPVQETPATDAAPMESLDALMPEQPEVEESVEISDLQPAIEEPVQETPAADSAPMESLYALMPEQPEVEESVEISDLQPAIEEPVQEAPVMEITNDMFDMGYDLEDEPQYSEENIDLSAFKGSIKDAEEINKPASDALDLDAAEAGSTSSLDMSNLVAAAMNTLTHHGEENDLNANSEDHAIDNESANDRPSVETTAESIQPDPSKLEKATLDFSENDDESPEANLDFGEEEDETLSNLDFVVEEEPEEANLDFNSDFDFDPDANLDFTGEEEENPEFNLDYKEDEDPFADVSSEPEITESTFEPEAEPQPDSEPEPEPQPEPDLKFESALEPEAEPVPQPEPETQPESDLKFESALEPDLEFESDSEPDLKFESELQPEVTEEPQFEPEPQLEFQAEPDVADYQFEAEPEPALDFEADLDADRAIENLIPPMDDTLSQQLDEVITESQESMSTSSANETAVENSLNSTETTEENVETENTPVSSGTEPETPEPAQEEVSFTLHFEPVNPDQGSSFAEEMNDFDDVSSLIIEDYNEVPTVSSLEKDLKKQEKEKKKNRKKNAKKKKDEGFSLSLEEMGEKQAGEAEEKEKFKYSSSMPIRSTNMPEVPKPKEEPAKEPEPEKFKYSSSMPIRSTNMPEVPKPKEEPAKTETREPVSQPAATSGLTEDVTKIQAVTPEMLAEERKEVEHVHTHHDEKVYAEKNIYDNGTFQREYYQLYYQ